MADESNLMTAEQFAAERFGLPDGGRWTELVAGQIVTLDPPDISHGNAVLNLSKAVADCFDPSSGEPHGSFCFEKGLLVSRSPDTVRFPAMCYLAAGNDVSPRDDDAQSDDYFIESPPQLVVELASSNRRRRDLPDRIEAYHDWGVAMVWVADPVEREFHVCAANQPSKRLREHETLHGSPVLSGLRIGIAELFAEPSWWRG